MKETKAARYSFYLFTRHEKPPHKKTINGDGIVAEGKHLLYATTKDDAHKIARQRAKKYRKMNPKGETRFYYMSDEDPRRLACFDCFGSFYRDTVRSFMRTCIGYLRYRLSQLDT